MDGQAMRRQVYFNEYNPFIGNSAYLPLVSGKLHAYALTSPKVRESFDFRPYLFRIDRPDVILADYDSPSVVCFSAAIWNERLCLHVAAEIKRRWPECLIIFGGSQAPHDPTDYMRRYPFIDIVVRAEGEETFLEIMERLAENRDFAGIDKTTYRDRETGEIIVNPDSGSFERDLDRYPSPYLEGMYDDLLQQHKDLRFQAIIETNRGCPFLCTFCYWGKGGLSRKYRYFGIERVRRELEWIGRNKIAFVYNADSNFGMHRRDEEIADALVEVKQRYGYPEKIVNLYGKNTDERIFRIVKQLFEHGLHKGVGLSRQSMSAAVLENIKRANISLEIYESLQSKFEQQGIPVFCELILGLPGETYESFAEGIDVLLNASLHSQLIIVLCELYPNTEMADPEYQRRHGVIYAENLSQGVHSRVQDAAWVPEKIDYVIGTDTMPVEEWKRTGVMSWTTLALTGLRLGYYLMQYLRRRHGVRHIDFIQFICEERMSPGVGGIWRRELAHYDAFMEQILAGKGRGIIDPEFGDIYWAVEEASFLRIAADADRFYAEMLDVVREFLTAQGKSFDDDEVREAVRYQQMRIPTPVPPTVSEWCFSWNFPEYFESLALKDDAELSPTPQKLTVQPENYDGDRVRFAREKLLWARRGGKFEVEFTWYDTAVAPGPTTQIEAA
jgi:radical SAM superfamily enzyme YgiQ (UPF0313 family)